MFAASDSQVSAAALAAAADRSLITMSDASYEKHEQNTVGKPLSAVADTLQQNNKYVRIRTSNSATQNHYIMTRITV